MIIYWPSGPDLWPINLILYTKNMSYSEKHMKKKQEKCEKDTKAIPSQKNKTKCPIEVL